MAQTRLTRIEGAAHPHLVDAISSASIRLTAYLSKMDNAGIARISALTCSKNSKEGRHKITYRLIERVLEGREEVDVE